MVHGHCPPARGKANHPGLPLPKLHLILLLKVSEKFNTITATTATGWQCPLPLPRTVLSSVFLERRGGRKVPSGSSAWVCKCMEGVCKNSLPVPAYVWWKCMQCKGQKERGDESGRVREEGSSCCRCMAAQGIRSSPLPPSFHKKCAGGGSQRSGGGRQGKGVGVCAKVHKNPYAGESSSSTTPR